VKPTHSLSREDVNPSQLLVAIALARRDKYRLVVRVFASQNFIVEFDVGGYLTHCENCYKVPPFNGFHSDDSVTHLIFYSASQLIRMNCLDN
jgi:hypothetical protein